VGPVMAYYECFSFLIRFAYASILPGVYYIPRIRLLVVLILHAVRVRLVFHAYGFKKRCEGRLVALERCEGRLVARESNFLYNRFIEDRSL